VTILTEILRGVYQAEVYQTGVNLKWYSGNHSKHKELNIRGW